MLSVLTYVTNTEVNTVSQLPKPF